VHSNGYSLVRKLTDALPMDRDPVEVAALGAPLGDVLLRPTRIYVKELLALHARDELRGAAHITGGGFTGNVPRCLPPGLGAVLDDGAWPVPPIFTLLQRLGGLSAAEMHRTFNNGLGMIVVVRPEIAADVAAELGGHVVGRVVEDAEGAAVVR
jgi:phosphoribosylformylglycinamidine cyclo-ligase